MDATYGVNVIVYIYLDSKRSRSADVYLVIHDWGGKDGSLAEFRMNQHWGAARTVAGRPFHTRGTPRRNGARKSSFLSEECPAGLLSTSADFDMAYIVVAAMIDMLANPVCSSCNTIMLLCIRFWTAPVASVVHVTGRQLYGQSREVSWCRCRRLLVPNCSEHAVDDLLF